MASAMHSTNPSGEMMQQNPQAQADTDNATRVRTVMTMLSGFANECMQEWGCYPGMAQDMANLKNENLVLKQKLAQAGEDITRLWQDNETLDRNLKKVIPERDRFYGLLSQSPESQSATILKLQQENSQIREQHAILISNTERLVNDGLALGVLLRTEPKASDGQSPMNVHFRQPEQPLQSARHTQPVNTAQYPTSNVTPSHRVIPPQGGIPIQQSQQSIENVRRQSLPSHSVPVAQQTPSPTQHTTRRASSGGRSPVEQNHSRNVAHPDTSQAARHNLVQIPSQRLTQAQQRSGNPRAHTHPQPLFHPNTVPQSGGTPTPQRSAFSPLSLSQVQMPPQNRSVPLEHALSLPTPSQRHIAPTQNESPVDAQVSSPAHPRSATHTVEPSVNDDMRTFSTLPPGRVNAGPPPPTPPQSVKSLSPQQEYCVTLPSPLQFEPRKRASVNMNSDTPCSGSPKRMRFGNPVDAIVQFTNAQSRVKEVVVGNAMKRNGVEVTAETSAAAIAKAEDISTPSHILEPEAPSKVVTFDVGGSDKNPQEGETEDEDTDDDESDGTKEDAVEELFIHEQSNRICTLCRERRKRDGDKHSDSVFDRNTSTAVFAHHLKMVHQAVWDHLEVKYPDASA